MLLQRFLVFICVWGFASGQAVLPPEEVTSLKAIAKTLGKRDWNFSVDPCSRLSGWVDPDPVIREENALTCDCNFVNNTICHVVSIILKAQNLNGSVPQELTRLPFLQEIDLTQNYLNGSIPPEWGSMKLVNISLRGNRITGSIPKELGNITTLANLTLESNLLSGTIPPELGSLPRIESLIFGSNNLTGEIPSNLSNLITLKHFHINDNNFTGEIPNFIQSWKNIERLVIGASGLVGPIPLGIASLTNLSALTITDLSGNESTFPRLSNIRNLKRIILRRCNIVGELPSYIGEMAALEILDLSFNKLSGPIPNNLSGLPQNSYIYLTGNSLNGTVPSWMQRDGRKIDLSYNNLTTEDFNSSCQLSSLNLFASSKEHTSGIASCLRSVQCENEYHSVRINCGGVQVVDDSGATYEEDLNPGGPTNFYLSNTNWGFSNTGHFLDGHQVTASYISSNISSISGQNPQLYMDARHSPLSLTFYAFCLINGNYTVNLHFAEIMFTNDSTYNSLGRRLFDVYIQEKLVLKDFNIEHEAGGVNMGIKRNFTAIVDNHTLDIHFYWAGRGTNGITRNGVYGPLISAISVDPDFPVPAENRNRISAGAIVGIVLAVLFVMVLVLALLWWKGWLELKDSMLHDLGGLDPNIGSFSLRQIKAATNNFHPTNKIGEGGFGPVYKGHLSDGTIIAVKQLSSKSRQGGHEFVNEIGLISALQHPHLVKLYGCCTERNQLLLVYEYMENNSLARALFGPEEKQLHLNWSARHKICLGIARGLAFLHEESTLKVIHRDITATNVLLDKNLVPKISDFGIAKLDEGDNTHISTRIAGTFGYMAPEYAMHGYLTDKADVYSFGIVLLEIVSGRSNTWISPNDTYLLDWANSLKAKGNLLELVDPKLGSNFKKKEVMMAINVALLCTNAVAMERPSMSAAVNMLEGNANVKFVPDLGSSFDEVCDNSVEGERGLLDEPSRSDLYPVSLNTDYLAKRDP